jgi:hypothetical protein
VGNENQNKPYFLYVLLLLLGVRLFGPMLHLSPSFHNAISIINSIVLVVCVAIESRNRSGKFQALLLFVAVSICIILFTLYFGIINIDNFDGNIIIFVLCVPIVIVLLAIVYKTLNQIIQYYKYK